MRVGISLFRNACVLLIIIAAAGCASLPRTPFTVNQQAIAQIPGIPGARYWADAPSAEIRAAIRLPALFAAAQKFGGANILAISGGASDGAFGAGILTGLTARGQRPQFLMVTGVSAGALIAPLAFLGSDYDADLTRAWTSGIAASLGEGGILSILFAQESRRAALYDLVASFADQALLNRIAEEHRRGRRLLVVTTNLDAQRPVVWDLGTIAASGQPKALDLIRNVLTASASVPGAFPPTLIEVEAGGRTFAELHVDGGATMQVFTIPEAVLAQGGLPSDRPSGLRASFFIIVNNRLKPDFDVVAGSTGPVLARSFSSLIKTHTRLTLVATREFTRDRGIDFNLAYIGDDYPAEPKASFGTAYMRSIYQYGFEKATSGNAWDKQIPFLKTPRVEAFAGRR